VSNPFANVAGVRFLVSLELLWPGSFQIYDLAGQPLGRVRRDGTGFGVVLMNFALEDSFGRPVLLIRSQRPKGFFGYGTPFSLTDPSGRSVGELSWSARQEGTLAVPGRAPYMAQVPIRNWKEFTIQSSSVALAHAVCPNPFLPRPSAPGGLQVDFVPSLTGPDQRLHLVALAAFICIFRPPAGWPVLSR